MTIIGPQLCWLPHNLSRNLPFPHPGIMNHYPHTTSSVESLCSSGLPTLQNMPTVCGIAIRYSSMLLLSEPHRAFPYKESTHLPCRLTLCLWRWASSCTGLHMDSVPTHSFLISWTPLQLCFNMAQATGKAYWNSRSRKKDYQVN